MPGCSRHHFLCAFTGTEPDLCPVCHRTWRAIQWCTCVQCRSAENHMRWHQAEQESRARRDARRGPR